METMQTIIEFTENPIDCAAYITNISNHEHGAQNVFIGKVRQNNMNRQVIGIEYEIFTELATTVFNQLANEARANIDPLLDLVIINRSGYLQVGEISILIIASSKHRDEAFRACRFIIEEIKHRAPIWKQEHFIDGKSDWVQGHALCQHR